jgi:hypothetical protein
MASNQAVVGEELILEAIKGDEVTECSKMREALAVHKETGINSIQ